MNLDSLVDITCVESIKELLDATYKEVLANFLRNTQHYIDEIGLALQEPDRTAITFVAHKMKSSAGQFGFKGIEQLSRLLEYNENDSIEALLAVHAELQQVYKQTLHILDDNSLFC